MKKILSLMACAVLVCSTLFADEFSSLTKNLNALSGTKAAAATGTIPEGKDLLPVLWYNATKEVPGEKILSRDFQFTEIDAFNEVYSFDYQYSYKFGFMTQTTVCEMKIQRTDSTFQVVTEKMYVAGKTPSENRASSQKSMNEIASQFAQILTDYYTKLSQEQYDEVYNEAYTNLYVIASVNEHGTNKIKLKKWFDAHQIQGKEFNSKIYVTKIDESQKEGYAYKIEGRGGYSKIKEAHFAQKAKHKELYLTDLLMSGIPVRFYTNDEKFIDLKECTAIENLKAKILTVSVNESNGKVYDIELVDLN